MSLMRLTGDVLSVDVKSFTYKQGDRAGQLGAIRSLRVLVGGADITECNLPDALALPAVGDGVDFLVDVSPDPKGLAYGRPLAVRVKREWCDPATGVLPAVASPTPLAAAPEPAGRARASAS